MLDVVTLLASEGVSVDVFTGRATAYNLVETLFAQKFPARVPRLHTIVQYYRPSTEGAVHFFERVELLDPDGKNVLGGSEQEITITSRFHTSLHNAWNIVLAKGGDYMLTVSTAETKDGPWTLARRRVILVEQAPHPLMPPTASEPPAPPKEGLS
jgi:hypothetical protein